jgi:hypothetical protein
MYGGSVGQYICKRYAVNALQLLGRYLRRELQNLELPVFASLTFKVQRRESINWNRQQMLAVGIEENALYR